MRKTINVEHVKRIANDMLRDSVPEVTEGRQAVASMLERVLHDTGQYRGFQYLPGVVDHSVTPPAVVGDESRRVYY